MAPEWWHPMDIEGHLETTKAMVRRSMDVLSGSRRALAEWRQTKLAIQEHLAASRELLRKDAGPLLDQGSRTGAPAGKSP